MRLTIPQLDIKENEGFSAEKDIFNRKPFGEALHKIISSVEDELVIGIDAKWGEGKTTFVKMWRGDLLEKGVRTIYFDAFKNDFIGEPFSALSGEIYGLAKEIAAPEKKIKEYKKKAIQVGKVLLKSTAKIGIKALTLGVLDGTEITDLETDEDIAEETSKATEKYVSSMFDSYEEDRLSLDSFRGSLMSLAESIATEGKPLVFIIDELDRCKPTFALELLEKIKHIFSVPKIVFVLVMNTEQIEESVKSQYGSGINATQYLQKFINVWCHLPKRNGLSSSDAETYFRYLLKEHKFPTVPHDYIFTWMIDYLNLMPLTLREIEQAVTNLIMTRLVMEFKTVETLMIPFIAILKVKDIKSFIKLKEGRLSYPEAFDALKLNRLRVEWDNKPDRKEKHPFTWVLRCCMIDEEEMNKLPVSYFSGTEVNRHNRMHVLSDICNAMTTFLIRH